MAAGQESDRLVDGEVVTRAVLRTLDLPIAQLIPAFQLGAAMRRLLVELADGVRIDGAVVVDARLRGESFERAWAA